MPAAARMWAPRMDPATRHDPLGLLYDFISGSMLKKLSKVVLHAKKVSFRQAMSADENVAGASGGKVSVTPAKGQSRAAAAASPAAKRVESPASEPEEEGEAGKLDAGAHYFDARRIRHTALIKS